MKKIIAIVGMSTVLLSSLPVNNFVMAKSPAADQSIVGVESVKESKNAQNAEQKTASITVKLDGNIIDFKDQQPVIINGRTLVPFRAILEAMNAEVKWDGTNRTVRAFKDGIGMVLEIGNKVALVGTSKMEMQVPAQIINGRTMVPLRFVSEGLKYNVAFNNDDKTHYIIDITSPVQEKNAETNTENN